MVSTNVLGSGKRKFVISQNDKQTLATLLARADGVLSNFRYGSTQSAVSGIEPVLNDIRKSINNGDASKFSSYADRVHEFLTTIRLSNKPSSYINSATSVFHNLEIKLREISSSAMNHSDDTISAMDFICHAIADDEFASMTVDKFRDFLNP